MYALAALVGAIVSAGLDFGVMLAGSDPVVLRPIAATFVKAFFGAMATALVSLKLAPVGFEGVVRQAKGLRRLGLRPQRMRVVPGTVQAPETPADVILDEIDRAEGER